MATDPDPISPDPKPVNPELQSLRRLLTGIALSLLILAGGFNYFLLREVVPLRRQLDNVTGYLANHESRNVPIMRAFRDQLEAFARANPDFRPILEKYIVITYPSVPPVQTAAPTAPVRSAPPTERGR